MNNPLFLYLSQTRVFWWLRAAMARLYFWIERKIFGVRYSLKEEKTNYQSLQHLFLISQKPLFIAIGVAAICQYVDPYLIPYYQKMGICVPDDGDYVTFLAAVSGIGGVFIGLYYAAISAVVGAIYATVPNNILKLLVHERRGNVYMRFLAFLTCLGLILIALRLSGLPRLYVAIPFVTILAGVGIVAFVKLGQQAFYFFDPTTLSGRIFEQLQRWLGMVKAGGYRWQDKVFQHHAYRQSSDTLDTLDTLSDFTASKTHLSGTSFINLTQNLLRFLMHYEFAKRCIPSDSSWYEQRYQHRDWYRTDDSRVSIAHLTGTSLQPVVTTDKEWIEGRVIAIVKKCIETNLAEKRYSDVHALFEYLDAYVKVLAKEGAVERAFKFIEEISLAVLGQFAKTFDGEIIKVDVLEKLAVAERLASLPISVALGYREFLEKLNRENVEQKLSCVRWDEPRSIYQQGFPTYCLARIEWFRPRLEFERKIEGQDVTPPWYQTELICQVEADIFSVDTKALVDKGVAFYKSAIAKALSYKHPWLAASIMSRELEYWHKIENQLEIWPEKWASLSSDRHIDGLPWSQFDIVSLQSDSQQRQHELLKLMSQQSMLLALISRPEGYPDYAGQFLHTSGEAVLDALLANNVELVKSVFEPYLHGCLLKFDSLRPKAASLDWRVQQDFKIAAAALLDVMDISGYAKLLSAFYENEALWGEVTATWNKYLTETREQSPLPLLAGAVAFTEAAFEIPHRAALRTTWQQKINSTFAGIPRHEVFHHGSLSSDTVIDHDSALIRVFAQEPYGSFHDGIDVFIAYFLRMVVGAKDLDYGSKRRDLQDVIDREERSKQRTNDDERDAQ